MFAIIGLGNPGYEYENTRHNLGFAVVNSVAEKLNLRFIGGRECYISGIKEVGGARIILVKPLSYMNNSGIIVKEFLETYHINLNQALVVIDDFNLPLGTIRIRERGSSGGHNGLYSIIYHLQSEDIPRLRCGIASEWMPKRKDALADFVLSPFIDEEIEVVQQMIIKARDASIVAATENFQTAINRFNRKTI
ncbi:MAG: aminoacyl-tRNA hydrolase [Bacteroidota bacterium]|nr:aminoacyl-tRNA hydrolase [Bacteroidota bacterium]